MWLAQDGKASPAFPFHGKALPIGLHPARLHHHIPLNPPYLSPLHPPEPPHLPPLRGCRAGPEHPGLRGLICEPHPQPAAEQHVKNNALIRGSDSASTIINSGSACAACTSDSLFHSLLQDLLIINPGSCVACRGERERGGGVGGGDLRDV